uniref:Uncharacterized protein n=1 Tax=Cucumis melo TaxID=3656 RepID=A0A9I9E2I7_CUCME
MKNVGANSDIYLVLFDEENRAVGFHSKSGGPWFFLDKLKRSCARDSGSVSVLRVICVYARGIRFICLQSRQIQVQKSIIRRLHAIFRSKVAGSPGGGVTLHFGSR